MNNFLSLCMFGMGLTLRLQVGVLFSLKSHQGHGFKNGIPDFMNASILKQAGAI